MMISVQAGRISFTALRVAATRFARRPLPFAGASPGQGRMSPSARDARPALIAIGSRDGGRPAAATAPGTHRDATA